MPIEVQCVCGKRLSAPDSSAGKRGKCPACGLALVIPQAAEIVESVAAARVSEPQPLPAEPPPLPQPVNAAIDDDEYRLAPDPGPPPREPDRTVRIKPVVTGPPQTCPSCQQTLPPDAKLCVACGIDLKTGKSIRVSQGLDEDFLYGNADTASAALSWIIPLGIFPIASDAYGKFKPYAIWVLTGVIVLTTVLFWLAEWNETTLLLMLWTGSLPNPHLGGLVGLFRWYQLITNTFLHAGPMHLAGNMVFLLVFGSRINALIGQWQTVVVYFALAVGASVIYLISRSGEEMAPALGASGAIMGLAGMYFVLMPSSKVHMIAWLRLGLLFGFERTTKFFTVPGFAVLLCYIAIDIVMTVVGARDGTAHWAHLGGFLCGIVVALALLLTRQVDARGGDMLSLLLGRHAWKILGTPAERSAKE